MPLRRIKFAMHHLIPGEAGLPAVSPEMTLRNRRRTWRRRREGEKAPTRSKRGDLARDGANVGGNDGHLGARRATQCLSHVIAACRRAGIIDVVATSQE